MQGLVTNLAESSSQADNTQDQGTSAHILETIEEETTSSPSTDSLGETLDALGIIDNAKVRMPISFYIHGHARSINCYMVISN